MTKADKPKKEFTEKQIAARFKPGQSGNPTGRPKGVISLTKILRDKMNEMAPGQQRTYAEAFITGLLDDAINKRKGLAQAIVYDRYEGKAPQTVVLEGGETPVGVDVKVSKAIEKMQARWSKAVKKDKQGSIKKDTSKQ